MIVETPEEIEAAYLATDDPRGQSGFRGDEARWEAARRAIAAGIDAPGTLLGIFVLRGSRRDGAAPTAS